MDKAIVAVLQRRFPKANFRRYFSFLDSIKPFRGKYFAIHHIAPRSEFPKLVYQSNNKLKVSLANHFRAHYYLALAVPSCRNFQCAFYLMACTRAYRVRLSELSSYAQVYEKGLQAAIRRSRQLNKTPHMQKLLKKAQGIWKNPEFVAAQRVRARKILAKTRKTKSFQVAFRKAMKKLHRDPKYRAKARRSQSRILKALWKDPEFRARNSKASSERMFRTRRTKKFKQALQNGIKTLWQDKAFRARHSKASSNRLKRLAREGKIVRVRGRVVKFL
jgi:hypothetical protein